MNLPISSSAPSGYVISQRSIASHNQSSMSQGPKNAQSSQMTVTTHHQNPAPHQQGAHGIQFAQSVTSLPGLVQQPPTMMQTVSANGFQYTQPLPMLQQGQILQPVYHQGGQPQMLIAPQGNFALQQPISQSLAMMQGQKVQQSIPMQSGKPMVAGSAQQMMTAVPQTMTLSAAQKIQVVNHKQQNAVAGSTRNSITMTGQSQASPAVTGQTQASTTIAMTGHTQSGQMTVSSSHTHPQFVTSQNANGALLINMLPQGGMIASQQDMSQQNSSQQQQQQQQHQQQQQQQQQQPIEVSVAHAQQLLSTNNNQTVNLGQPQIPLQAFNPFTNGISWTSGQLQGGQVLQSPIFIRNPSDGTLYIHNPAPSNQQQQSNSIAQSITLQTRSSMSTPPTVHGNINVSTNVQPATSPMNQQISQPQLATSSPAQLPTRVSMTPPISSATNNAIATTTACSEPSTIPSVSVASSAPSSAPKETPRLTPGPWNHPQPFRISRPPAPIQPLGLKVTMMPRGVRGIVPRPPRQTSMNTTESTKNKPSEIKPFEGSASRCAAYDFSEESSDSTPPLSKFLMKTVKSNASEPSQDATLAERAEQPLVATVPPLECIKKPNVAAIPAAGIPDASETGGSTSPAIAATFPSEDSDLPESHEEASEILTHIVEGFVIREGPVPFPVTRTALLNEILAREQMVMQNIKERKRKHESAVAASNARLPGNFNKNTYASNAEKDHQSKGSTAVINEKSEAVQAMNSENRTSNNASRTSVKTENQIGSPRIEPKNRTQTPAMKNRSTERNEDDDNANVASVIDNVMNSKNLGLNISPPAGSSQSAENVTASIERVAKNEPTPDADETREVGKSAGTREPHQGRFSYISGNAERGSVSNKVNSDNKPQEKEKDQRKAVSVTIGSNQRNPESLIQKKVMESSVEVLNAVPEMGSFSTRNPLTWTVQEVFEFIKTIPGCAMYAEEFRSQEIDGEAMLFLKVEHLMTRLNIKLGPAAKICARLKQLQAEVSA